MTKWLHGVIILSLARAPVAYAQATPTPRPDPAPLRWHGLIGEYRRERDSIADRDSRIVAAFPDTLVVFETDGRLVSRLGTTAAIPLVEVSDTVFIFTRRSPQFGDTIVFRRDGSARAGRAVLRRLRLGPADGVQLRLTPVRPVADLLREDRVAVPPRDSGALWSPDLVELVSLDTAIHLDIRYATTNNFLGSVFYSQARAFLQRPAAEALLRAQRALRPLGYGLLIHDAYRPWYVTKVFWDATPAESRWLVANPASGSKHNRGAAVDLTLYDRATGRAVEMPSTYDEASPRALSDYPGGTSLQRWHRALLKRVMEAVGFAVNPNEWWHFDFGDWRRYPILNLPFEELGPR